MARIRILLGSLFVSLAVVAADVQATTNQQPLCHQVSSIQLDETLVEANTGGRAALCS